MTFTAVKIIGWLPKQARLKEVDSALFICILFLCGSMIGSLFQEKKQCGMRQPVVGYLGALAVS